MKILLLDVDSCYFCPCSSAEAGWLGDITRSVCQVKGEENTVYMDGVSGVPEWCPLRLLPNKIVERGKWISEEYQNGWNAYRKAMEKMQKGESSKGETE